MGGFNWLREIRCILFDWGGTLCRNERERDAIVRGITGIAAHLGFDEKARVGVAASLGKVMQQAYLKADADPSCREVDVPAVLQAWGEQMGLAGKSRWDVPALTDALWEYWPGGIELLARPIPVLTELRRRGYRLGLLSNVAAPPAVCRAALEGMGLLEHFESCTFSSEIGLRKPHPDVFRCALEAMRDGGPLEPRNVVYVGDSPRCDIGGAQAASMRAVLFRGGASDWSREDSPKHKPDAIIDRMEELLVLFLPR